MKFAIYKYELVKTGEQSLFKQENMNGTIGQDYLDKLLSVKQLNLFHTSAKTGEPTLYPNTILKTRDGVTLMRVCNVKHLTLVQDYKEHKLESNPYCHVLIDNRPGVGQMAIEQSGAFDGEPDKVRDILQESLHAQLADVGLTIEIRAKMLVMDFWETVEYRMRRKDECITRVVFEFSDPQKSGPIDAPAPMIELLKYLNNLSRLMGAAKSQYQLDATSQGTLKLDRTQEDLAQMVGLCCNNGYQIVVHFKHGKAFRNGDWQLATFDIEEEPLNHFVNGQCVIGSSADGEPTYALVSWLDDVREYTKDYNDATQIERKRKRKYKRVV